MPELDADFPLTSTTVPLFLHRSETGSTNAELAELARGDDPASLPGGSVLVADRQTSGRGRLGRSWEAPIGTSLAASILVRPALPSGASLPDAAWGWFPLLAGLALRDAVEPLVPGHHVQLKWPNDVQIDGKKVSGLLGEAVAVEGRATAVVMGAGVNLTIPVDALPTPTSTSLAVEGAPGTAAELGDLVLVRFVEGFRMLVARLEAASGDPVAAGLPELLSRSCYTVGLDVRVELPGGTVRLARAVGIDSDGRLLLRDAEGEEFAVAAGDVTHLRHSEGSGVDH